MNDDVRLVEKPEEQDKAVWTLFLVGIAFMAILFITGSISGSVDLQRVVLVASLLLIVSSIFWGIRKKIASVVIAYGILALTYFACALFSWFILGVQYSFGMLTVTIISAFVVWLSKDKQITYDDVGKTLLFIILTYVANWSGWLADMDALISTLLSGQLPI